MITGILSLTLALTLSPVHATTSTDYYVTPSTQNMQSNGYAQIYVVWMGNTPLSTPIMSWGDGTSGQAQTCLGTGNGYCIEWLAWHTYTTYQASYAGSAGQACDNLGICYSATFEVFGPTVSNGSGGGGGGGGGMRQM